MGNYFSNWSYFSWPLHLLFCLIAVIGIAFFLIWAAKELKAGQLLTWGIILTVVGGLGLLLSSFSGVNMFNMMNGYGTSVYDNSGKNPYLNMPMYRYLNGQNADADTSTSK